MSRLKQHKTDSERCTGVFRMRVSEETMRMMRRVAQRKNMTISRTIVELFRNEDGTLTEREQDEESPQVAELKHIRAQIWRIGHNINQIAHNVNRDMNATSQDEASAAMAVRECSRLLDRADAMIRGSSDDTRQWHLSSARH